ncbi:aldo/keto reductase [Streptomyces sp. NPDC002133]|uniref:aldo/keto reductase n=1 Tax=Streptomyces sp. NPDC002133 TaxID=3154409 RepID=UPI00332865B3
MPRLRPWPVADVYATGPGGDTEAIIGRWFATGGSCRERTVPATEVYLSASDRPGDRFLSARHIRHACDASLKRLGAGHIDLCQMHHIDGTGPGRRSRRRSTFCEGEAKCSTSARPVCRTALARAHEAARSRHSLGLVTE